MTLPLQSLLLLLVVLSSTTTTTKAHTEINIYMPSSLYQKDGYAHSTGHFGRSPIALTHVAGVTSYGSMSLQVYVAPTNLCHHPNETIIPKYNAPFLFLTTRGECTFVRKTRHAQFQGAAGVLITDNRCLCSDAHDQCNVSDGSLCQDHTPIVADDGSGGDVAIPTILLKKQDGETIATALKNNQTVLMTLKWEPNQPNTTKPGPGERQVHYGMVLDLMDPHTPSLTSQMEPIALAVGKQAQFWPSYLLYSGLEHCQRDVCSGTCTNQNRYCYPHIKGAMVIEEILRRLCIWRHYGDTAEDKKTGLEGEGFWNYIRYFDQNCAYNVFQQLDGDDKKNQECIAKALKQARVDSDDVGKCFEDTGHPNDNVVNTLLEDNLQSLLEYGVITAPHIWVDRTSLPHSWSSPTPTTLLQTICNGFQKIGAPRVCTQCLTNPKKLNDKDITTCARQFYHDNYKHPHRHIWRTLFLLAFILVGGAVGYVVWRRRQDGMDLMSDGLFNPLQGYMPLLNGGGGGGGVGSSDQGDVNGIVPEQQTTIDFQ